MFKINHVYLDTDSKQWRVLCTDAQGEFPILAIYEYNDQKGNAFHVPRSFRPDGSSDKHPALIPSKLKVKAWVIYSPTVGRLRALYDTEPEARRYAASINCRVLEINLELETE